MQTAMKTGVYHNLPIEQMTLLDTLNLVSYSLLLFFPVVPRFLFVPSIPFHTFSFFRASYRYRHFQRSPFAIYKKQELIPFINERINK